MSIAWPPRGKPLGGLDAKDYVDAFDQALANALADLTAGTGNMRNEDNLFFLADFAAARDNLGVPSFGEVDVTVANAIADIIISIGAVTSVNTQTGDVVLDATSIPFTPNGSISATDVQTAIQEVRDEAGSGAVASVNGQTGTVVLTAADVSADASGAAATAQAAAIAASQPVDADLTAIAALTTTSYGRALLALVDAAALRTVAGLGTVATHAATEFDLAGAAATAETNAKAYADLIAAGFSPRASSRVATAAALPACTYANGASGVGATLTANANGALTVDTVAVGLNDRVLVKDQASAFQNGIYTQTQVGTGSVPWILTRAPDADQSADVPGGMVTFITEGTAPRKAGAFVQLTPGPLTIGTDPQVFDQSGGSISYTFSNGLVLTGSNVAPTYGSTADTVTQGNDARLSDARTPTAHAASHASAGSDALTLAQSQITGLVAALAALQPIDSDLTAIAALTTTSFGRGVLTLADGAALRTLAALGNSAVLNVGTTAGTVAAGNDSRFTDGRTPLAHKVSHQLGGTDELALAESQVTNLTSDLAGKLAASDNLAALANKATSRTNLGVQIGANVQAWDADLDLLAGQANTALGRSRLAATRSTFSNADFTVLATDTHVDQIGTLTADRVVTLPAANAVPAGWRVSIANSSAVSPSVSLAVGAGRSLRIEPAAGDGLLNESDQGNTAYIEMRSPLGSYDFVSNGLGSGNGKWKVVSNGLQRPYLFWSGRAVACPDGVWTPQPWNVPTDDPFGFSPGLQTLTTTVAAASDGTTLPTAGDITVASTSGFPSTGFLAITGPPQVLTGVTSSASTDRFTKVAHGLNANVRIKINGLSNTHGVSNLTQYFTRDVLADSFKVTATFNGTAIDLTSGDDTGLVVWTNAVDTVVSYTATDATHFKNCNTAGSGTIIPASGIGGSTTADFSTGTLKTGMTVTGANCRFTVTSQYLWAAEAYVEFDANDTGRRNIMWMDGVFPFFIVTKGNDTPATGTNQVVGMATQPGITINQYSFVSVYQSSGGVLNTVVEGILAPLLMMFQAAGA